MVAETGLQKGIKKADTFQYPHLFFLIGRGDMIRTCDTLVPNQVLYQAELRPEWDILYMIFFICQEKNEKKRMFFYLS